MFFSQIESKFGFEAFSTLSEESIKKLKSYGANYDTLRDEKTRVPLLEKVKISKDERDDIETYFRSFPQLIVTVKQTSVDESLRPVLEISLTTKSSSDLIQKFISKSQFQYDETVSNS